MMVISERKQVREVAASWQASYGRRHWANDPEKQAIGLKLQALDPETATAAQVAEIIGNESWVKKTACHECGSADWNNVQLGQEPDYESHTATICLDCLRAAVRLAEEARK